MRTSAPIIENAWKLYVTGRDGTVKETVAGVARDLWDYSRNIQGYLFGEENLEDACGGT